MDRMPTRGNPLKIPEFVEVLGNARVTNPDGTDIGDALPTSGNNPSLSIAEATVGTVTTTTIQKTIGATTYEQTIEEDSSDNSVEVSNWSEI